MENRNREAGRGEMPVTVPSQAMLLPALKGVDGQVVDVWRETRLLIRYPLSASGEGVLQRDAG